MLTDEQVTEALQLAYRALTEGMADVPVDRRDKRCAALRVEAKRAIRRVLGIQVAECGEGSP